MHKMDHCHSHFIFFRSIAKDDESITSQVTYISPSGTVLSSIAEVCKYLESEDTCKCGLECPLYVSKVSCLISASC